MSAPASGPGGSPYWTFVSRTITDPIYRLTDDMQNHVLYKPLEELKDEMSNDLLEIRIKIKYSSTIQSSEEVQLRQKITERLYDYFYDCDPGDVDKLADLIEFKEWPEEFGVPDTLSINGKQEGPTLLILLRPKEPLISPLVVEERKKRYKKIQVHEDSKHSIKALSRIHSMKARRK